MFDLSVCYLFLQYFDTVGWVFWPVKTVSHITYTVLVEMLNHAHSLTITILYRTGCKYRQTYRIYQLSDRPISNVLVINRQYWLHIVSKFVPFNFTFLFIIMNEHAHEKFRVLWNVIFAWNPLLMITCCWQLPTFHSTGALLCARDALLEASLGLCGACEKWYCWWFWGGWADYIGLWWFLLIWLSVNGEVYMACVCMKQWITQTAGDDISVNIGVQMLSKVCRCVSRYIQVEEDGLQERRL